MEGDNKLCKASFLAQPRGHAASTWPSPSAWTKTRSLRGCRNFYLLILPSLSFSLSFSLSLLLLFLDRTDVCSPLLCLFPTQFRAKIDFSRKKKEKCLLCCHRHTTVIAGPTCLIAHLLAPHDRAQSHCWRRSGFFWRMRASLGLACAQATTLASQVFGNGNPQSRARRARA